MPFERTIEITFLRLMILILNYFDGKILTHYSGQFKHFLNIFVISGKSMGKLEASVQRNTDIQKQTE